MRIRLIEFVEQDALEYKTVEEFIQSYPEVFHGTNTKFSKFNPRKGSQGTIWFTDDKETIINGESGAIGINIIMVRYLSGKKWAGWDEYDKLMIGQLKQQGYDGVKLPAGDHNDYMLFDNRGIFTKAQLIKIWNKAHEENNK
jgi:hypothetical protein